MRLLVAILLWIGLAFILSGFFGFLRPGWILFGLAPFLAGFYLLWRLP